MYINIHGGTQKTCFTSICGIEILIVCVSLDIHIDVYSMYTCVRLKKCKFVNYHREFRIIQS